MRRFQRIIEPIDDYLSSVGLYRKVTAKDGSCLFRAVAEQVFHTQALHLKVREACIQYMENNQDRFAPFVEGPFDHHLYKLKNPKEWAGQVEISALSLMYKRDFHVYQEPGMGAFNVTQNGFPDKVVLCFSHGNHYDSVFSRKFQETAAITQAVIYEILYKDVFKLSKQVDEAVEILRCSNKKPRRDSNCSADGLKERDDGEGGMERDGRDRYGRYHEEKRRPPLPYRVAKALDPEIYRNVEYDAWNEERKEQQHQDFLLASGMQYVPGDKCQVFLDDPKKMFNAHIQDVQSCNGPVTVFIEDLGEKHTIPMKNLRPTDPSHRPWSPLSGRHYKNLTGYYHKFSNGVASDSEVYRMKAKAMRKVGPMIQTPNVPFNSHYSSPSPPSNSQGFDHGQQHQHPPFIRPLMQHDKQSPRSTSPYQKGKGNGRCNHTMHNSYPNSMVQEEYDEKRALEESLALFELQERDSTSFPSLPGHQSGRINLPSPVNLWDKFRKEGRKSVSPIQRMNTPSPVAMFDGRGNFGGENIQARFQDMSLHDNGRGDGQGAPNPGRNHFSRDNYHTNQQRENAATPHDYSPNTPKWHSSNSTLSTSGSNACHSAGNTPSPPSVPMMPSYNAAMPIGIPLYPMVIPLTDNLTGPVNASATASRDPNGYDLPLSDVSTMRYYYNLGIEYHHRLYLFQMQQWQQQQQQHQQQQLPVQQTPDHPPCTMVSQTQHQQPAQQHMMQTSVATHYSPEGPVSVGGNVSEEEVDEGMQQRACASNGCQQDVGAISNQQQTLSSPYMKNNGTEHLNGVQQQQHQQLPLPMNAIYFTFPPRTMASTLTSPQDSTSTQIQDQQYVGRQISRSASQLSLEGQQLQQQQQCEPDNAVLSAVNTDSAVGTSVARSAMTTPMRLSMPLRIPTPRSEEHGNSSQIDNRSPSPFLPACPPEIRVSSAARSLVTPTRRKSPFDVVSPGVFPMSPFPVVQNTNPTIHLPRLSQTGPSQPYYIESPVHQHIAQQQQQQQQPTLQPPPAPVNTFFNPHANPTGIQTEPYAHVNYHPAPGNLGTYQYPVQGQWQPAFPYGSPVKVPTVAYGQSPPVTFIANTAPVSAPALYIPATH